LRCRIDEPTRWLPHIMNGSRRKKWQGYREGGGLTAMPSRVKWFYPGMRVKRWLALVASGVLLVGFGTSLAFGVEIFSSLEDVVIRPLARSLGALPLELAVVIGTVGC